MKAAFFIMVLLSASCCALSQPKKDRIYRRVMKNIIEVQNFKKYLLSKNYSKNFTTNIVYAWQEINDPEIKRFCKKFNVRTIHIIPKYPSSTDMFIEGGNRIELEFNTLIFFSAIRNLVYDCSSEGLKLKSGLSSQYEIADKIYLF